MQVAPAGLLLFYKPALGTGWLIEGVQDLCLGRGDHQWRRKFFAECQTARI